MPGWRDRAIAAEAPKSSWRDRAIPAKSPTTEWEESAVRGAAQGVTFGLADEGAGVLGAAKDIALGPAELKDYLERYKAHRDESRGKYEKAQKDNPKSYIAGDVAGSMGSAFVPGLGFANAAKGASVAARLGRGALAGGLAGAGTSKVDLTKGTDLTPSDVKQGLVDVGVGAGFGAAGQGVGEVVGKGASKVAKGLDEFADWNTLKAAGAMTKDRKALRHQKRTKDVADFLRKSGVVTFGSTVDDSLERSKALQGQSRESISDALMQLDDHVARGQKLEPVAMEMTSQPGQQTVNAMAQDSVPTASGAMTRLPPQEPIGFVPSEAAKRIEADLISPMKQGPHGAKKIAEQLQGEVDDLAARGDTPMSFVEANKLKNQYYNLVGDYGKEKSPYIEGLKKFGGIFNQTMEDKADEVAKSSGDSELFKRWLESKKDFRNAATVSEMAADRVDQIKTNNPFGLTDYLIGAGAVGNFVAGDNPTDSAKAIPLVAANMLLRKRGASAAGVTANAAAKALKTKYAQMLAKAAKQGPKALSAAHFILKQQDPNYLNVLNEGEGNE